jgi:hypothetical protein
MVGRVKLSSGKTCPLPNSSPKPHDTGFGALPNINLDGSDMANEVKKPDMKILPIVIMN